MANSVNPDETAQVSVLVCRAERVKAEVSIEYNSLRKQANSNILDILPPKNEKFQIKILIFFIFLLKT